MAIEPKTPRKRAVKKASAKADAAVTGAGRQITRHRLYCAD